MVSGGKRAFAFRRYQRASKAYHRPNVAKPAQLSLGPDTTTTHDDALAATLAMIRTFAESFELRMMGDLLADPTDALDQRPEFEALRRAWHLYEEQSNTRLQTEYASGMVNIDARGKVTEVNETALRMLGFDNAGELVGASFTCLLQPGEASARLAEALSQTSIGSTSIQYTLLNSGVETVLDLSVSPRTQTYRCTILVSDITARLQLEHELRRARDLALMHERQASEFLANMSHELRTPMNGVIGMADLLGDTSLDPQQREIVHLLKHSGEHLLCIINDILDLSKLEAGHVVLEAIPVDLEASLHQDLHALEVNAFGRGLDFILETSSELPSTCEVDPLRLRQILTNLVGNAIKFTNSGYVIVRCCLTQSNGAPFLLLEVEDSGVGIEKDVIPKLFAPFTQADAGTARKYGGTGLGLAICKKLTNYMGGEIGARSAPGYGSTFWFTLPLVNPGPPLRERYSGLKPRKVGISMATPHLMRAFSPRANSVNLECLELTSLSSPPGGEGLAALVLEVGEPLRIAELAERFQLKPEQIGVVVSRSDKVLRDQIAAQGATPISRTLPLSELLALTTPARAPTSVDYEKPVNSRPFKHVKLLVAEDNPVNQKLVVRLLEKLGAQVLLANDGIQAVEIAKRNPDLMIVFMDCQMPNMDGFDATREIRKIYPDLPICALTANAMSTDRDKCFDAGMNDYLTKPIRRADLAATLRQWTAFLSVR